MKLIVSLKDDVNLPSSDIVVSNLGYTITYVEESSSDSGSDEEIVQARTIDAIYGSILANPNVETYSYMEGTYLKGNITNNYVWYNGFIWRIMGKNADGSIRLITEENVTGIPWGASNTTQNYGNGYIKDWVNNYFLPRIKDTSKIVSTLFCEDSTLVTLSSSSRTTCSNPVSARAGLLSLDEYNLAGGSSSYLKNRQIYWTLTSYSASSAWNVNNYGSANYSSVTNAYGVRAVIMVSSDMTITSGNGTLSSPYEV